MTESGKMSIQERIRAMNQTIERVDALPVSPEAVKVKQQLESRTFSAEPPRNHDENDDVQGDPQPTKRVSVVDMWRKREATAAAVVNKKPEPRKKSVLDKWNSAAVKREAEEKQTNPMEGEEKKEGDNVTPNFSVADLVAARSKQLGPKNTSYSPKPVTVADMIEQRTASAKRNQSEDRDTFMEDRTDIVDSLSLAQSVYIPEGATEESLAEPSLSAVAQMPAAPSEVTKPIESDVTSAPTETMEYVAGVDSMSVVEIVKRRTPILEKGSAHDHKCVVPPQFPKSTRLLRAATPQSPVALRAVESPMEKDDLVLMESPSDEPSSKVRVHRWNQRELKADDKSALAGTARDEPTQSGHAVSEPVVSIADRWLHVANNKETSNFKTSLKAESGQDEITAGKLPQESKPTSQLFPRQATFSSHSRADTGTGMEQWKVTKTQLTALESPSNSGHQEANAGKLPQGSKPTSHLSPSQATSRSSHSGLDTGISTDQLKVTKNEFIALDKRWSKSKHDASNQQSSEPTLGRSRPSFIPPPRSQNVSKPTWSRTSINSGKMSTPISKVQKSSSSPSWTTPKLRKTGRLPSIPDAQESMDSCDGAEVASIMAKKDVATTIHETEPEPVEPLTDSSAIEPFPRASVTDSSTIGHFPKHGIDDRDSDAAGCIPPIFSANTEVTREIVKQPESPSMRGPFHGAPPQQDESQHEESQGGTHEVSPGEDESQVSDVKTIQSAPTAFKASRKVGSRWFRGKTRPTDMDSISLSTDPRPSMPARKSLASRWQSALRKNDKNTDSPARNKRRNPNRKKITIDMKTKDVIDSFPSEELDDSFPSHTVGLEKQMSSMTKADAGRHAVRPEDSVINTPPSSKSVTAFDPFQNDSPSEHVEWPEEENDVLYEQDDDARSQTSVLQKQDITRSPKSPRSLTGGTQSSPNARDIWKKIENDRETERSKNPRSLEIPSTKSPSFVDLTLRYKAAQTLSKAHSPRSAPASIAPAASADSTRKSDPTPIASKALSLKSKRRAFAQRHLAVASKTSTASGHQLAPQTVCSVPSLESSNCSRQGISATAVTSQLGRQESRKQLQQHRNRLKKDSNDDDSNSESCSVSRSSYSAPIINSYSSSSVPLTAISSVNVDPDPRDLRDYDEHKADVITRSALPAYSDYSDHAVRKKESATKRMAVQYRSQTEPAVHNAIASGAFKPYSGAHSSPKSAEALASPRHAALTSNRYRHNLELEQRKTSQGGKTPTGVDSVADVSDAFDTLSFFSGVSQAASSTASQSQTSSVSVGSTLAGRANKALLNRRREREVAKKEVDEVVHELARKRHNDRSVMEDAGSPFDEDAVPLPLEDPVGKSIGEVSTSSVDRSAFVNRYNDSDRFMDMNLNRPYHFSDAYSTATTAYSSPRAPSRPEKQSRAIKKERRSDRSSRSIPSQSRSTRSYSSVDSDSQMESTMESQIESVVSSDSESLLIKKRSASLVSESTPGGFRVDESFQDESAANLNAMRSNFRLLSVSEMASDLREEVVTTFTGSMCAVQNSMSELATGLGKLSMNQPPGASPKQRQKRMVLPQQLHTSQFEDEEEEVAIEVEYIGDEARRRAKKSRRSKKSATPKTSFEHDRTEAAGQPSHEAYV